MAGRERAPTDDGEAFEGSGGNEGFDVVEELVLAAFHAAPGDGFEVVLAGKMEQAMDDIASQFLLPGSSKGSGLVDGIGDGDEEFAMETAGY